MAGETGRVEWSAARKIVAEHEQTDSLGMLQQLGALPL